MGNFVETKQRDLMRYTMEGRERKLKHWLELGENGNEAARVSFI